MHDRNPNGKIHAIVTYMCGHQIRVSDIKRSMIREPRTLPDFIISYVCEKCNKYVHVDWFCIMSEEAKNRVEARGGLKI